MEEEEEKINPEDRHSLFSSCRGNYEGRSPLT